MERGSHNSILALYLVFTRLLILLNQNHYIIIALFAHRSEKAAVCLLPNSCLGIAVRIFAKFESNEVGLTWDKVSSSPSPDDDFSFSWVLGMLIIESLVYAVITWYDVFLIFFDICAQGYM